MLTDICASIRNYFCQDSDKHFGRFTISGGSIAPLDFLKEGQYFRVVGSVFNDGVHQYPTADLKDETFDGAVWAMSVPPAFIALTDDIRAWSDEAKKADSPYVSESYPNGYSYTKATRANGAPMTWQSVFADRLNRWRKI